MPRVLDSLFTTLKPAKVEAPTRAGGEPVRDGDRLPRRRGCSSARPPRSAGRWRRGGDPARGLRAARRHVHEAGPVRRGAGALSRGAQRATDTCPRARCSARRVRCCVLGRAAEARAGRRGAARDRRHQRRGAAARGHRSRRRRAIPPAALERLDKARRLAPARADVHAEDRRRRARASATSTARWPRIATRSTSTATSPSCGSSWRGCVAERGQAKEAEEQLAGRARRRADVRRGDARARALSGASSGARRRRSTPLVELLKRDPYNFDALLALGETLLALERTRRRAARRSSACCGSTPTTPARCTTRACCSPSSTAIARRSSGGSGSWTSSRRASSPAARAATRARAADLQRDLPLARGGRLTMPIEGPLRELGIHDVFQLLDLSRKTGALRVVVGAARQRGHGVLRRRRGGVRVASAATRTGSATCCVRGGKISEADLARARAVQQKGDTRRLGEILLEQGPSRAKELERQLRLQIEEVVFELMSWREGYFSFEERAIDDAPGDASVRISTESLLMEGARRIDEWSRIADKVPHVGVVPVLAPVRRRSSRRCSTCCRTSGKCCRDRRGEGPARDRARARAERLRHREGRRTGW